MKENERELSDNMELNEILSHYMYEVGEPSFTVFNGSFYEFMLVFHRGNIIRCCLHMDIGQTFAYNNICYKIKREKKHINIIYVYEVERVK